MNEDTNAATDGKRQNEPAFATPAFEADMVIHDAKPGISRLEYFAAAALTGLASELIPDRQIPGSKPSETETTVACRQSFDIAEAMCAESQRRAQ